MGDSIMVSSSDKEIMSQIRNLRKEIECRIAELTKRGFTVEVSLKAPQDQAFAVNVTKRIQMREVL